MAERCWLLKTEADCFSIHDLAAAPRQTTYWSGVRNFQARNFMRDEMKLGDRVLFYHSNAEPPAIVGTAVVVREGYPDHTAWDPTDVDHFDPKASPDNPIWQMVDIRLESIFDEPLALAAAARRCRGSKQMELLRKGSRLSVQPVTAGGIRRGAATGRGGKTPAAAKSARRKPARRKRPAFRREDETARKNRRPAGKRGATKTSRPKKAAGRRRPASRSADRPRARICHGCTTPWPGSPTRSAALERQGLRRHLTRRAGPQGTRSIRQRPAARADQFRLERLSGIGRRSATDRRRPRRRRGRRLGGRGQSAGERLFGVARAARGAAGRAAGDRSGAGHALGIRRQCRHDLRLVGRGDAVFGDSKNHASLIDGCRLSRAEVFVYPHGDCQALEEMLAGGRQTAAGN